MDLESVSGEKAGLCSVVADQLPEALPNAPSTSWRSPRWSRRAGLALCCVLAGAAFRIGARAAWRELPAIPNRAVRLQAEGHCENAEGWANDEGRTCAEYEENPDWCSQDEMVGQQMDYPELNCCVCGGGSTHSVEEETAAWKLVSSKTLCAAVDSTEILVANQDECQGAAVTNGHAYYAYRDAEEKNCVTYDTCDSIAPTRADWKLYTSVSPNIPPESDSRMCMNHAKCIEEGHAGLEVCCPNQAGDMMGCCGESQQDETKSDEACEDSPHWTNGYIACANQLTEKDGCTPGGLTCAGYVGQGYCKEGKAAPGWEHTVGAMYNHPELHCCACGKGPDQQVIW